MSIGNGMKKLFDCASSILGRYGSWLAMHFIVSYCFSLFICRYAVVLVFALTTKVSSSNSRSAQAFVKARHCVHIVAVHLACVS